MKAKMYFDGGCRPNPGKMKIAVIFLGSYELHTIEELPDQGTNNLAEWIAFVSGLQAAVNVGIDELEVYGDSQLVVNQFKGDYRVKKEELKPLYEKAIELAKNFKSLSITHVPRGTNIAGIYLEENY